MRDIPNEIKVGYSPIGFVRCGRSACRISKLKWKMGKETGGKKMEDPHSLKSNEMAQCSFQPQQSLVCDSFENCEGLSRVAFMDGNGVVMLGKLKAEAERLGKGSFAFAFYMDRQKEGRERGVTIACTTKEFYTEKWHYTIIDAPGHRDFIKNMITGASQADVALIMVPCDGNFTTAIAKGNHKAGEIQGQTRQHSRLINLLGVKQIAIGCNKMDCDTAGYKQSRYDEVSNEMRSMLVKVGWKKDMVEKQIPFLPISGWMGDNLLKCEDAKGVKNMGWWTGNDVDCNGEKIHVDTVYDFLDKVCKVPERPVSAPMRMPVSGIYKIKGVGDVLAGRVEQGVVKPGEEVIFLPTHTASNPCTGKVFTVEMHHQRAEQAKPGDNVGLNIKGLVKNNMPRSGDVMVYKKIPTP